MITKFQKYNESLRDLMVGPTKEEVWSDLINGKLKGLLTLIPESSEDFFNQMKEGCIEMGEEYGFIVFGKNGIKLFWQDLKNRRLWISHKYIWSIFENIYRLEFNETQSLIKDLLLEYIKWNGLKPLSILYIHQYKH